MEGFSIRDPCLRRPRGGQGSTARRTPTSPWAYWGSLSLLACGVLAVMSPLGRIPGALGLPAPSEQAGGAPETPIDRQLRECIERDSTTAGMVRCAEEARQAWDRELQRTYAALLEAVDPPGRQDLQRAQTAWVAFRDAESVWLDRLYAIPTGTMYPVLRAGDEAGLVKERALRLRSYLEFVRSGAGPGDPEASERPIDRRLRACSERHPTPAGKLRCQEEAFRAWDRELNRAYRALLRELDPRKLPERFGEPDSPLRPESDDVVVARRALRSAQRAWLAYRDAEFAWLRRLYGQKADPASAEAEGRRRLSLVRARVRDLEGYLRVLEVGLDADEF